MEICRQCIIPSSFPEASFERGTCRFCRDHTASPRTHKAVKGRDKLLTALTPREPGSSNWDCAIPLSGGKDSSYILFYVVRVLHLKPIALFFDNGFAADMAKRNVAKMCEDLGVDLIVGKASRFRRKLMKEGLIRMSILPTSWRGGLCDNCENDLRTFVNNECSKRSIPFILWGSTDFEDNAGSLINGKLFRNSYGIQAQIHKIKKKWNYAEGLLRTVVYLLRRDRGFSDACRFILSDLKCRYFTIRDNIEMSPSERWKRLDPFLEVPFDDGNLKLVYFYDYLEYDPIEQIRALREELHWESPAGREMRMDCRLHIVANYGSLKATGLTDDGFVLSTLVRNGLLHREDAMKKEATVKEGLEIDYLGLLNDIGIDDRTIKRLTK